MYRRTAEVATVAAEYKAKRVLIAPDAAETREKAIANRVKRAHGAAMHNKRVGVGMPAKGISA
jgi:hypothetical protein